MGWVFAYPAFFFLSESSLKAVVNDKKDNAFIVNKRVLMTQKGQ
jgi:hypothetical protein